jgi:hypothetical protein
MAPDFLAKINAALEMILCSQGHRNKKIQIIFTILDAISEEINNIRPEFWTSSAIIDRNGF